MSHELISPETLEHSARLLLRKIADTETRLSWIGEGPIAQELRRIVNDARNQLELLTEK